MVRAAEPYVTYEDYLAAEQANTTKHEWLDGVVYAMAGGSLEHSRLAGNMHTALKMAFEGCEVFQSVANALRPSLRPLDLRGRDAVCGPVEAQKVERNKKVIGEALINPTVIVEVLSDSTEQYDRGEKFAHYMKLPSLEEYVLVSQDEARIEVFRRPARDHWSREQAGAGETIAIHEKTISVDAIYRRAATTSGT